MGKIRIKALIVFIAAMVAVFNVNGYSVVFAEENEVYIGGFPVIIEMYGEGLIVTSVTSDYIVEGTLAKGDMIKEMNGKAVRCVSDVTSLLNGGGLRVPVELSVCRGNSETVTKIMPELDLCTEKYMLGVTFKEQISGLGTVTCIKKDGNYCALGHSITDPETGASSEKAGGYIYKSEIIGVQRATANKAGRLIGKCIDCRKPIGTISGNGTFGLTGEYYGGGSGDLYSVADRNSVKPGKAQIYADVDGERKFYDIEIVKASKQSDAAEKGLVIKVTDKDLLRATGGIVQGMSGSPIIQNGELAGAVTHVFTNDCTRGYGVYAEWFLTA